VTGLRVAVVGGGIGGLVLGIDLRARGVAVEVYEQADELREVGAAVALSANATRELVRLGIGDDLAAVSTPPSSLVVRHWRDGAIIVDEPMGETYRTTFGAPFYGVHRVDFLRVLSEHYGAEDVRLGHRCVELRDGAREVQLTFANGAAATADVVVGADGVHSAVRRRLTDAPPVFSGTVGYRGLVPVEGLPTLPDPMPLQYWAGPGRHLLHYSLDGGRVVNFLAVVRVPGWEAEAWMEPCAPQDGVDAFAGWHPAVTEMVGAVDAGARWALFDHAPLERWRAGRVVLLGDAAHAMLPHQGQGANQTIEDAATLAACLAEADPADVDAALDRYEAARRPRTTRVQAASRRTADLLHLPDGDEATRRDALLTDLPRDLAWIHGHDVGRAAAPA
jgi:salicylate hydroxylase